MYWAVVAWRLLLGTDVNGSAPCTLARDSPSTLAISLGVVAWLVAVAAGVVTLWRYDATAGIPATAPARWPAASTLARTAGRATLVVALHPHCPCSRATLGELALLMPQVHDRARVHALVLTPADLPASWSQTDVRASVAAIPGVSVHDDVDGREALRFGAATSGQVLLYDPDGALVFNGGITPARGHRGANVGRGALEALLHGTGTVAHTPVFGCALRSPSEEGGAGVL